MIRLYAYTAHSSILSIYLRQLQMFFANYRLYHVQYLLTMYEATWVSPRS